MNEVKEYLHKSLLAQRSFILAAAMASTGFKNPEDFQNMDIHATVAENLNLAFQMNDAIATKFGINLPSDVELIETANTMVIESEPDFEFDLNKLL